MQQFRRGLVGQFHDRHLDFRHLIAIDLENEVAAAERPDGELVDFPTPQANNLGDVNSNNNMRKEHACPAPMPNQSGLMAKTIAHHIIVIQHQFPCASSPA
jgi:hypothetical protein